MASIEKARLQEAKSGKKQWKKWGPYLSERQWGTVREDYSESGDAWEYFSHKDSKSRAYRWGEDGMAGISDDSQQLCFAIALWNGNDPILKERLFGLTNSQGNHGEDVKEYYFYLDSTPTHSWMKYLYKYPHAAFPYKELVDKNQKLSKKDPEFELLDTGIFDDDKYFDVFVEYAKNEAEDTCIKISAFNRGLESADLHLLPTLWFRNTWSWDEDMPVPVLEKMKHGSVIHAFHSDKKLNQDLGEYYLYCDGDVDLLFTNNESNNEVLFNSSNNSPYVKDGINYYVVNQNKETVNPAQTGTKASAHYQHSIPAGGSVEIRLRLVNKKPSQLKDPFKDFNSIFKDRQKEADDFYNEILTNEQKTNPEHYKVARQAFAGMLWSKQFFYYDVSRWLQEHGVEPLVKDKNKKNVRNKDWHHMETKDIISMPDKWEYPWFAAWDLAFHVFPLKMVDPDFAKQQLDLILRSDYIHPNGQMPAYEWNFGDVNPPVHAWAAMQVYLNDRAKNNGKGDVDFLRFTFGKLLLNFTWWVNRKDLGGNNLFQGGFLGLDNIGVFDRSKALPTGGHLEQADGTAWMAFFSMQMLRMCFELALEDPYYVNYAYKFFSHTMWMSSAMDHVGEKDDKLWDEEDGFFYDLLHFPDGSSTRLKIRSMVGLLPLMSVSVFPGKLIKKFPELIKRFENFNKKYPDIGKNVHHPSKTGVNDSAMIAIVNENKLRRILHKMLDESEFLGPYGLRSMSLYHKDHPYVFHWEDQEFKVAYLPGESDSGMFGGNSNWRGPVWMPVNVLILNALLNYYSFYGKDFKIECPTGSGNEMTLLEVAKFISARIAKLFLKDGDGRRPANGDAEKFNNDPHWKELVLFYEYFHGDSGKGIGASHQTGWTGFITEIFRVIDTMTEENFDKVTQLSSYSSLADS